jgi:hypothetical protein
MKNNIDFKTYRYFYVSGIVRINRMTRRVDEFINGRFVEMQADADGIEKIASEGCSDALEFDENSPLLKMELNGNNKYNNNNNI